LVADDHTILRDGICALLALAEDMEVVGEARDGVEGVKQTGRLKPDVITMDIKMPRMDGHEATKRIMATTPTPIVVVSSVTRQEMIHEGMDILLVGALEIVQKPSTITTQGYEAISEELLAKVKAVSGIAIQKPGQLVG